MTVRVLDPRASAEGGALRQAPPLKSLAGTVIGMIDNGKIGTAQLFTYIADILRTQYGAREFMHIRKPDATKPVPHDLLVSMAGADAILAATGD